MQLDILNNNIQFNLLCLSINLFLFTSYLLTIGIKFVNSPSYYIIDYLNKNNPGNYNEILMILEKNLILEKRINKLINEKMINDVDNKITLTNKGKVFCKSFTKIKNFFDLKNEG